MLGTGVVGRKLAGKLRELGHDVLVGSRSAGDDAVPFADAAAHGELVFNCTNGNASLSALNAAGTDNLAGKVLIDVANVMVDPSALPGKHDIFVCGDDEPAKAQVAELLQTFGWPADCILDLGDISAARGLEQYLTLWLRLLGPAGGPSFNIHLVH